jgi:tetratricopeptide (TPR) repeat protein
MNYDYCFMKWVSGVFIFVMLLMTACSSVQELSPRQTESISPLAGETGVSEAQERKLLPTDPDVMYHVFSAEIMGAEGDLSGAAAEYLEAALISEDSDIAERAARVAVSAGEWQMVVLASDRWAMLDPNSLDARELAVGSRLREGDYAGAEFQLARLLELTASDQKRGWRIVTALLAPANDQVRASKVLDNLLVDFDAGSNADALFAQSQFVARTGDLDKAIKIIDKAIGLSEERSDLLAWSGRLAVNHGDEARALENYRKAWAISPDDPQIALAYAELLKRSDELDAAQKVLAQLSDTPEMRFTRIAFALDAGDRDTADLLYKGFSQAQYDNASNAALQAAQSAELLEYPREAIGWYEQVTGEQSLRAILRRAFLLAGLDEVDEARHLLGQLRSQADDAVKIQSYHSEAQILQNAGLPDKALIVLNDALSDFPEDISLQYTRALLNVTLGRLDLAEIDLRRIIAVQPDNTAAINALGYSLADLTERYDEAEELILQAYQLQPDDPAIIDSMGWVAYRLGRLDEAVSYLRQAWEMLRNAEVAAHLGEVLWVLGQREEARSVWRLGNEMESGNIILIKTMQRFGEQP